MSLNDSGETVCQPGGTLRFSSVSIFPLTIGISCETTTNVLLVCPSMKVLLAPGTGWVTYVRCHDDIGWAVSDADAWAVGVDPFAAMGSAWRIFAAFCGTHVEVDSPNATVFVHVY